MSDYNDEKEKSKTGNKDSETRQQKVSEESFGTYFLLMDGVYMVKIGFIILVAVSLISFNLLKSELNLTPAETIPYVVILATVIETGFLSYFFIAYQEYKKFISGKSSLVTSWRKFVNSRSPQFWKGRRYVKIRFTAEMNPLANSDDHEEVKNFLMKWAEQGAKIHDGTRWKKGSPDRFSLEGNAIHGHVNVGSATALFVRQLIREMPMLNAFRRSNVSFALAYDDEVSFEE
jgi:hypothetical protein